MKIYVTTYTKESGKQAGYSFHVSARHATSERTKRLKENKHHGETELIDVPNTLKGFVAFLNKYAGHPDPRFN